MGVHKKNMHQTTISNSTVTTVLNEADAKQIVGLGLTKGMYDSQSKIKTPYSKIVDAVGIRSDVIVAGNSILGVTGTASSGDGKMDTSDGNITTDDVVSGKIGYNSAGKVIGNVSDYRGKTRHLPSDYYSLDDIEEEIVINMTKGIFDTSSHLVIPYAEIRNVIGLYSSKLVEGASVLGVVGKVKPFKTEKIRLYNTENDVEAVSGSFGGDTIEMRPTGNKFYVYDRSTKTWTVRRNHSTISQSRFIIRNISYLTNSYDICFEITKTSLFRVKIDNNNIMNFLFEVSGNNFSVSAWTSNVDIEFFDLTYEVI